MKARTRTSDTSRDDGAALLLVLVFVTVIGLVIAALLTQADAQYRARAAGVKLRDGTFAADYGLEHAISNTGMLDILPVTCAGTPIELVSGANGKDDSNTAVTTQTVTAFPVGSVRDHAGLIVASVAQRQNTPVSVKVGTVAMIPLTPIATRTDASSTMTTQLFYLLDAAIPRGVPTADVTMTATASDRYALHVAGFAGVEQLPPVLATSTNMPSGLFVETTVTPAETSALIYSAGALVGNRTPSGSGAGTRLQSTNMNPINNADDFGFGSSYALAANTNAVAVRETFNNSGFAVQGVLVAKSLGEHPCPTTPAFDSGAVLVSSSPTITMNLNVKQPIGKYRMAIVAINARNDGVVPVVKLNGVTMTATPAVTDSSGSILSTSSQLLRLYYLQDADLPAGPGIYPVVVTGGGGTEIAVHASVWLSVLQSAPVRAEAKSPGGGTEIQATAIVATDKSLVYSAAAGTVGCFFFSCSEAGLNAPTGTTQLTGQQGGQAPSQGSFGTSFGVLDHGSPTIIERFKSSNTLKLQDVLVFGPSSATKQFRCDAPPDVPFNGFTLHVTCTTSDDHQQATITAAAAKDGSTYLSTAVVTRKPDDSLEITSWDSRPGST